MNLVVVWPSRGAIISRRMLGWTDGSPWGESGYIWPDFNNNGRCGLVVEEYAGAGEVDPMLVGYEQVALVTTDYAPTDDDNPEYIQPDEGGDVFQYDVPMLEEPLDIDLLARLCVASEYISTSPDVMGVPADAAVGLKFIAYVDLYAQLNDAFEDDADWRRTFREFVGEMLLIEAMSHS